MKTTRMKKAASLLLALALLVAGMTVPASASSNRTRLVEAGNKFSLFVTEDGDLYGCGSNDNLQLGGGVTTIRDTGAGYCVPRPQYITGNVKMVAAPRIGIGSSTTVVAHTLVLKEDGSLYGMGSNSYYQLGFLDDTQKANDLRFIMDDVKYIAANTRVSAAITTNGDLYLWGDDGIGLRKLVLALTGVKQVEMGDSFTVVLKEDGSVWTYGYTYTGALGDGSISSTAKEFQKILDGCVDIAAGYDYAMAVKANGDLYGWGNGAGGRLGLPDLKPDPYNDEATYFPTPTYVTSGVRDVECGERTTYFIKSDNSLYAMGSNYNGELGRGVKEGSMTPIKVASGVAQVSAGSKYALILKTDGTTYGCGRNYWYELGAGFSDLDIYGWIAAGLTASPIIEPGTVSFTDVSAGEYYYEPVIWAVENYITNGTSDTTFSPNSTCTRAQILTFLWRANGSPRVGGFLYENYQTDLEIGAYYAQAARWATDNGLLPQSGNIYPNSPCTRAMVVEFLWKLAGSPSAPSAGFSDVPASASYAKAVDWAVSKGITNGTSTTTFSPDATCTRGQIVTFLWRAMK